MSGTFPARWGGECDECFAAWEPGDDIGYNDFDELVCEDCLEE